MLTSAKASGGEGGKGSRRAGRGGEGSSSRPRGGAEACARAARVRGGCIRPKPHLRLGDLPRVVVEVPGLRQAPRGRHEARQRLCDRVTAALAWVADPHQRTHFGVGEVLGHVQRPTGHEQQHDRLRGRGCHLCTIARSPTGEERAGVGHATTASYTEVRDAGGGRARPGRGGRRHEAQTRGEGAQTSRMRRSWLPGKRRSSRSWPSPSTLPSVPATSTTCCAPRASATAAAMPPRSILDLGLAER